MDLSDTSSARSSSLDDLEIIEPLCAVFRRRLKAEGLKYTPERAQILDAILSMDDVFQADRLLESMKGQGFRVSRATVYRTIKLLEDAKILQQVLVDSEQAHYQLAYGTHSAGLIVRTDTHEISSIEAPGLLELRNKVCAELGLKPEGHRFVIYASAKPAPDA